MSKTVSTENRKRSTRKSKDVHRNSTALKNGATAISLNGVSAARSSAVNSQKASSKISEALRYEIVNSPDAVVEVVYPLLGKLLKKFMQRKAQRVAAFFMQILPNRSNIQSEGIAVSDVKSNQAQIETIMFINSHSKTLISEVSYALDANHKDFKMLFDKIISHIDSEPINHKESLIVDIDAYSVHIQFFEEFIAAITLLGDYHWSHKNVLEDKLITFAQQKLHPDDLNKPEQLHKKLAKFFKRSELNFE